MQLERHEIWRAQYRARRYMEHLDESALQKRLNDIITNFTTLGETGKLGLRPVPGEGEYWAILWTHIVEEYDLRSTEVPNGSSPEDQSFPKPSWPDVPKAVKAIKGRNFAQGKYLFKYGKVKFLSQTLKTGGDSGSNLPLIPD